MDHAGFFCPCGADWERYLPDRLTRPDEAALFAREWGLLVCSRRGAETLRRLRRRPRCRTALLPGGCICAFPGARQTVDCGLDKRSSLTLSSLTPQPVLCIQRRLTDVHGGVIEPQELPLPAAWTRFEAEPLLLLAGARLLLGLPAGQGVFGEGD